MENTISILIADDDPHVRQSLAIYLKREGYMVYYAADGEEAISQCQKLKPDLMILDIMMPRRDGLEVCREVRKFMNLPIIMLSARDDEIDKLIGLEIGADDYVTKPFSPREVVARIKAVFRRIHASEEKKQQNEEPDVAFPDLVISPRRRTVLLQGQEIALTPKEFDILYLLCSAPGHVYAREQLVSTIWGYDSLGDTRAVDTHIKRIRSKLGVNPAWELRTIWGVGYSFNIKTVSEA